MNIDEKKYPFNAEINIYHEIEGPDHPRKRGSVVQGNNNGLNNSIASMGPRYMIPKSALIEEFEKIPSEIYTNLLYGISHNMLKEKKEMYVTQFFDIICINNVLNKNQNIQKIDSNKININKVIERLNKIKHEMPDMLNTTEANPVLFKVNKYNELFNPFDECLQVEINHFNDFLAKIDEDINSLLSILKGDMIFVNKYYDMILKINQNKVPKDWSLFKYPNNDNLEDLDLFPKKIKDRYNFFNSWIYDGLVNVYDLSFLSNDRLFITLLPLYFQKKLPEGKASSDKIKLHFKLTKYDSNIEITEQILEEYKKSNIFSNNNEFIFIKGLKLKGFESVKEEERDVKYFKENENSKNNALPIIAVTFNIEEYQYEEIVQQQQQQQNEDIFEDDDDDEEEEIEVDQNEENKDENNKGEETKKEENENKEETKTKEEKEKAEEVKEKEEEKEKTEKTKSEREIKVSKDNTKVDQRIIVEETRIKSKKAEFLDNMKNKSTIANNESKDGLERSVKIRTKTKYYRKHCRLEIPFCEEQDPESYNINEPYGYIEIRFNCEKDKQEEYFRNKQLIIELDK